MQNDEEDSQRLPLRERLEWIYERYSRRILGFALRLERNRAAAEDLFSETMVRAMTALARGKETHGDLFPWLCAICANLYRDEKRRERLQQRYALSRPRDEPASVSALTIGGRRFAEHEAEVCWRQVREYIGSMPDPRRAAILLRHSGHSYQEIAELLGVDEEQVRSQIQNAMRDLRRVFVRPKTEESGG